MKSFVQMMVCFQMASETNGSVHSDLQNLKNIKFKRILSNVAERKLVVIEAEVQNSSDPAVIILEKPPWKEENVVGVLSESTSANQQFKGQHKFFGPTVGQEFFD